MVTAAVVIIRAAKEDVRRSGIRSVKSIFLHMRLLFLFSEKLMIIVGLMINIKIETHTKKPLSWGKIHP